MNNEDFTPLPGTESMNEMPPDLHSAQSWVCAGPRRAAADGKPRRLRVFAEVGPVAEHGRALRPAACPRREPAWKLLILEEEMSSARRGPRDQWLHPDVSTAGAFVGFLTLAGGGSALWRSNLEFGRNSWVILRLALPEAYPWR